MYQRNTFYNPSLIIFISSQTTLRSSKFLCTGRSARSGRETARDHSRRTSPLENTYLVRLKHLRHINFCNHQYCQNHSKCKIIIHNATKSHSLLISTSIPSARISLCSTTLGLSCVVLNTHSPCTMSCFSTDFTGTKNSVFQLTS